MKPHRWTYLLATSLVLAACGGGGDDPSPSASPSASNSAAVLAYTQTLVASGIQIPRELGDDRALILTDASTGKVTTVRGAKDGTGGLTELQSIETTSTGGAQTTVSYLNATDRRIDVDGKTEILIARQGDGSWLTEFVDRQTGTSFKTSLASGAAASASSGSQQAAALTTRSKLFTLAGAPLATPSENVKKMPQAAALASGQIPVTITTRSCGQVSDALASVKLVLNESGGKYLGTYGTTKSGPGTYVGFIPDSAKKSSVSLDSVKEGLEHAAKVMEIACAADAASPLAAASMCVSVSAAIAGSTLGVGTPVAAQFLAACESAVAVGKIACKVTEKVALPVPSYLDPASADLIPSLQSILISVLPDNVLGTVVTPFIEAIPYNVTGKAITISKATSALTGEINDETLRVGALTLDPSSPLAGVSYTASSKLQCVPFSSSGSIAVVGTDGYTDSVLRSWEVSTLADTLSLVVPGGATGVHDTVTLKVVPRIGEPVTRIAYLAFQ